MDMLRLTISCLTGFGALALVLALLGAAILVVTLRRMKREEQPKTEPLPNWVEGLEEVIKKL